MRIYEYENKESKEKARAADVLSILEDMTNMEDFNGLIESKIYESWYELKRQLKDALFVEMPEAKKDEK